MTQAVNHEVQPAEPAVNAKPKRRWFQFSLWNLLLLISLLCLIPGGFVAYYQNQVRRHESAIRAIEGMRATVTYDDSTPAQSAALKWLLGDDKYIRVSSVEFFPNAIIVYDSPDSKVGHLESMSGDELQTLGIQVISDAGLAHLEGMNGLSYLQLDNTEIGNAGLVHLQNLTTLRSLTLGGTRVTDDGLVHLKDLVELEFLNLSGTDVGDAGMAHLARLSNLTQLALRDTHVTDAGLAQLKSLTRLELLVIEGTQVTEAAADEFDRRPGLMVIR
jgi:hypothetical protein